MFYGKVIKSGEIVVPEIKEGYSVIHLSRACLNNPKDEGRIYLQVEDKNGCYNICCLQKNACEDTPLDIFLMLDSDIKIKTNGNKNDVHIVGYYEVSFNQDNLDEDDDEFEDEYDNEKVRLLTKKNTLKNSLTNGSVKKKKDAEDNEDDETNVGKNNDCDDDDDDDDDEDEDDEDEDDEDEDDDEDDDEEEDDREQEEDEEVQEEELEQEEEDKDDDDDEDDPEDDEDDPEDEEDDDKAPKSKNEKKKNEKKVVGNKNKRSLDNKNDGPTKKSKVDEESQYEKDLIAFLKKNGKSKLTELGKIKRPDSVKAKLGLFIKNRSNIFKFDKDGQIVSLK